MKHFILMLAVAFSTMAAKPFTDDPVTKTRKTDSDSGFSWTQLSFNGKVGAEVNGKTVIPCEYQSVDYEEGYFEAKSGSYYCAFRTDGKIIIPISKHATFISFIHAKDDRFIKYKKDGFSGAYSIYGNELISSDLGYDDVNPYFDDKMNDWLTCKIEKDKYQGIYDLKSRKVIISPDRHYDWVTYKKDDGYYNIERNGKKGACAKDGKELITPDRYTSVFLYGYGGFKYFVVKIDDKQGACDLSGKEVVPPLYENVIPNSDNTGFRVKKNGQYTDYGMTGSTGTAVAAAPASSSISSDVLYEGICTHILTSIQFAGILQTVTGSGDVLNVRITSTSIILDGSEFTKTSSTTADGFTLYTAKNGTGTSIYYNGTEFNFTYPITINGLTGITKKHFVKGSATPLAGNAAGGMNMPGYTPGTVTMPQQGRVLCTNCNGSGIKCKVTPSYGTQPKYRCPTCGQYTNSIHNPQKCPMCNGTGYR